MAHGTRRCSRGFVSGSLAIIVLSSVLGPAASAVAAPPRPDGLVRVVGEVSWLGNNVYNTTGARQTRVVDAAPGTTRKFQVTLQNDGRADSFKVKGTSGTPSVSIAYRYNGRKVTNAVLAGTFRLDKVASGAKRTLTVTMVAAPSAPSGLVRATVTFTSKSNRAKKDVVRAGVNVVVTPTPTPNQAPAFPSPLQMSTSDSFQYDPTTGKLVGATTQITVSQCVDPDGDPLAYSWSATNGSIVGAGTSATWNRVILGGWPADGDVTVTCQDPGGLSDTHVIQFR